MFIVRFIRNDLFPDECYYYENLSDAHYHYSLFEEDDSFLYCVIQLLHVEEMKTLILSETFCCFSAKELEAIKHYGNFDQFETAEKLTLLAKKANSESQRLLFLNARIHLAIISREKYPIFFEILKQQGS